MGCQLWCVLQQDIIAYRLCNPCIVEFLYFFGHMGGGLKTNVIMLTEAKKSPVSLKPLWLQFTTVVKPRKLFLCVDHLCGDFFIWLVCFSFLCCIRIILESLARLKTILSNLGYNMGEFWGYKKSSQVLKCSESVEEHEEVKMRGWGWGVQWWLH